MNSFDIIILIILAFFAVRSFFRGFVREAFSLGGIIAGVIAANEFYAHLGEILSKYISSGDVSNTLAYVVIFAAVALAMNILGGILGKFVKLVLLGWFDRLLGLAFGLFKGLIIIAILVMVLNMVLPATSTFLTASRLNPLVESTYPFIPDGFLKKLKEKENAVKEIIKKKSALRSSFSEIETSFSSLYINKNYKFTNFDNAAAELQLQIPKSLVDSSSMDWKKYAKSGNTAKQNYIAMIKGRFHEQKDKLKFVFDVFHDNLPNVSNDYLLRSIIRFVQAGIRYKIPPGEIGGVETGGILPPVVSLAEGYGDCDTKSLLFSCIASHGFDVIFLVGPMHAFVAIAGEPDKEQQFLEINKKKYLLCEMSQAWPLGKIPASTQSQIDSGKYYYFSMR